MSYDVVVIGGGPAGMFGAITAAKLGAKILLLEANDRLGKKLLITGKGRCNVTNNCTAAEVLQNVPRNGRFLYSAMEQCDPAFVMELFESNGCQLKTERGNRVFPVTDKSSSVLECLKNLMHKNKVTVSNERAMALIHEDGHVTGVKTTKGLIPCEKVILATGGCSYPATGSTGDGYKMAAAVGHTVVQPEGSLVPLETAGDDHLEMQGLSLRNVA